MNSLKWFYWGLCAFVLFCRAGYVHAQDSSAKNFIVTGYHHCNVQISSDAFSGNTMLLTYKTLPANQAGLNYNTLWLWRSTEVPWKYPPMQRQVLPSDYTQSGSYVLENVSITRESDFIACYSVDSSVKQICACSHLNTADSAIINEWVNIELLSVSTNSLTFRYTTMAGYLPATYGNWFGVWKGLSSPYNSFPPLGTGKPDGDPNSNTGGINNIKLESGRTYTLIYFTGKKLTNAAAMITFTVK